MDGLIHLGMLWLYSGRMLKMLFNLFTVVGHCLKVSEIMTFIVITSVESDRLSPWEAIPVVQDANHPYRTCKEPKINQNLREFLDEEFGTLIQSNIDLYGPFELAVDPQVVEDYYLIVPMPMTVDLIRNRLRSDYYRQVFCSISSNLSNLENI
jgi:hypothetical protein